MDPEIFNLQRRTVAHMTSLSWKNVPHVSYVYEPDITDFYNSFLELAEERKGLGHRITFNTMMLKVVTEGVISITKIKFLYRIQLQKS